ncbi:Putative magnesium chelatase [Escherichia coli]|uniref:Magnesium chelatase n=1 Tax=Escherichia coli TaxID=562 RepID=A0A376L4E6_ECOLX|nr:Putative magnesium chelatase [Escherichia coli]STL46863.1 Putative magnesium chelatase [Escherichia coli]
MSLSIVHTRAALGVNAPPITVEVHISKGLPGLTMVGLPETTVKEARDRVRSAIINSGYEYPAKKITINLAPADLPKEGDDMIYLSPLRCWRPQNSLQPIS